MLRVTALCAVFLLLITVNERAQSQPRGRALCIGLNQVDPRHYGSEMRLAGCRNDAEDLATILRGIEGFDEPKKLLDSEATVAAVKREMEDAAEDLNDGDLFVITIAAHGSQLPDLNGDETELEAADRLDETWLLFDRMWIDDERYQLFKKFQRGVRVLVVSDTCHSGSTIRRPFGGSGGIWVNGIEINPDFITAASASRAAYDNLLRSVETLQTDRSFMKSMASAKSRAAAFPPKSGGAANGGDAANIRNFGLGRDVGIDTRALAVLSQAVRSIHRQDALALYAARSDIYDPILRDAQRISERSPLNATVILLAACQDYQAAADGENNGAFTGTLKEVWNEAYVGTYEEFLNKIKERMFQRYFDQVPNYVTIGAPNANFQNRSQRPFSVRPQN